MFANGRWTISIYDAATRRVTIRNPSGREALGFTDALGRLTQVSAGTLVPKTFIYDSRGRLEMTHVMAVAKDGMASMRLDASQLSLTSRDRDQFRI